MERFIGREKELSDLQQLYQQKGFGMAVIYGRRRVGKSTLLEKFVQDKKFISYVATKSGNGKNTEMFTKSCFSVLAPQYLSMGVYDLEFTLKVISENVHEEKLILILDEFPYWAQDNEAILSVFQKYIDTEWIKKNILLIICGSTLSFMEDKVLSEKSPLYGRRSIQIKLEPFDYLDAAKFVEKYSYEEKAIVYGLTSGVAKYLTMFDDNLSLDENIQRLFFSSSGYFFDEPRNFLSQEFSDTVMVNKVIEQIAHGESELNVIADKIHESSSSVIYTLKRLTNVGLVEKRQCILEENNKKKVLYKLKDQMFRFWYLFVFDGISAIQFNMGIPYYQRVVKNRLHEFMGPIFEQMCQQYTLIEGLNDHLDVFVTNVGSWWGSELISDSMGKRIQSADVDIVGTSSFGKEIVVGECKFKNTKIDKDILDTLLRRAQSLPGNYQVVQYLFFSLSGYTQGFIDEAVDRNIRMITLEDIYQL